MSDQWRQAQGIDEYEAYMRKRERQQLVADAQVAPRHGFDSMFLRDKYTSTRYETPQDRQRRLHAERAADGMQADHRPAEDDL